jgi:hypothetical protein
MKESTSVIEASMMESLLGGGGRKAKALLFNLYSKPEKGLFFPIVIKSKLNQK